MSIHKKAILIAGLDFRKQPVRDKIGNPIADINTITRNDIHKIKHFLKTDIGGKWAENEIVCFPPENRQDHKNLINEIEFQLSNDLEYLFFYYVGHGDKDDALQYRIDVDGNPERFHPDELTTKFKSNNYLAILNSCRSNDPGSGFPLPTGTFDAKDFDIFQNVGNKYLQEIMQLKNQKVIVRSTQENQNSQFSDLGGVFFSECLMKAIYNWAIESNNAVLSVEEAIEHTNLLMKQPWVYPQEATIYNDGSKIPIAVV